MKNLGLDLLGLKIDDGRDGGNEEILESDGERKKGLKKEIL